MAKKKPTSLSSVVETSRTVMLSVKFKGLKKKGYSPFLALSGKL